MSRPLLGVVQVPVFPDVKSEPPGIPAAEERQKLLRSAAEAILKTGREMIPAINRTYEKYKNFSRNSLIETAAGMATLIGPIAVVLYEGNAAKRAVAEIQAAEQMVYTWTSTIRKQWYESGMSQMLSEFDPQKDEEVDSVIEQSIFASQNITKLGEGIQSLPTSQIFDAAVAIFGTTWEGVKALFTTLAQITTAVAKLAVLVGKALEESEKLGQELQLAILVALGIGAVALLA